MPMVRAMRMLNAIEAGTTSGAQLESLLADPGRLGEMQALLAMRGQVKRMASSSTAMTAVAASSTAFAAVLASSTAFAAVTASSTAFAAVWASNTATDAVMASSTAKLAVYNSDTALAQLQYNPTQVQRLVTNTATLSSNSWAGAGVNLVANGTQIIILRRYYSAADSDYINWKRDSTTSGVGHGPTAGAGGRTLYTGVQNRGCVSGTYTDTGAVAANNDTGNFVCAAYGLRRNIASAGGILYVYYIPVNP